MDADEIGRVYGVALERMVELLGEKDSRLSFGGAMDQAVAELGLPPPSAEVQGALLRASLKIIAGGRVPGCPDA